MKKKNPKIEPSWPTGESKTISRRGFLRGAGLTNAGTVMVNTGVLALDKPKPVAENKTLGPDAIQVRMTVNGHKRQMLIEPRVTLAQALREHLHLTGTKVIWDGVQFKDFGRPF